MGGGLLEGENRGTKHAPRAGLGQAARRELSLMS